MRPRVKRSAEASRAGLEKLLGKATIDGPTYLAKLKAAHGRLQPKLDELANGTVAAAKTRAAAGKKLAAVFARGLMPSWKSQVQFADQVDMQKLSAWSGELVALVGEHMSCAAFHEDVLGMQRALFALAGETLGVFVAEKGAAGVVDFGDMLAQAREVLARPAVQEALGARLDLVLVDEFQDTSPLQLAVVGELGRLAKRSIWVGDRKQAIFGFQGSDPELMTAATDVALGGRAPDILGKSWRSRKDLVELVSDLFSEALAPHGFPPEQVRLVAAKKDPASLAGQPSIECWRWTKAVRGAERQEGDGHRGERARRRRGGTAREAPARPRTRARRGGAAPSRHAARRGHPGPVQQALPADRRGASRPRHPGQGVARGRHPDTGGRAGPCRARAPRRPAGRRGGARGLLARRLGRGRSGRVALPAAPRGLPLARRLRTRPRRPTSAGRRRRSRSRTTRGSPAFARPCRPRSGSPRPRRSTWRCAPPGSPTSSVPGRSRGSGSRTSRRLRGEALAYEQLCEAQKSAATVLGLVTHLAALGADDEAGKQAAPTSEDAVTVFTWHKAKGLEWPVVVLSHLDFARERGVFEVAVEGAETFDFTRPLDGRWIRWWPWPYGKMSKGLALADKAALTPEAQRAAQSDRRERLRLLYVGFTRPRDLLVLAAGCSEKGGIATQALGLLSGPDGTLLLEAPFEAEAGAARHRRGRGAVALQRPRALRPPARGGHPRTRLDPLVRGVTPAWSGRPSGSIPRWSRWRGMRGS